MNCATTLRLLNKYRNASSVLGRSVLETLPLNRLRVWTRTTLPPQCSKKWL